MISFKDFILTFNIKRLQNICKRAKRVFKEEGLLGLTAKIRKNHHLKFIGVVLFENKRNSFFIKRFRYVYIKICSDAYRRINLYWHANNQLYETGSFYTQKGTAVYEFDLASITARAHGQSNKTSHFQYGRINNFGIRGDENIVIKWSKFSSEKLTFKKEGTPVVEMMEYPLAIHLEVTRKCNLKCYMCRENREESLKEIGMIDLDPRIVHKIIPFMQKADNLALFGWGEPLCHPNFKEFIEIVGELKERNRLNLKDNEPYTKPFTNFATNGYLMHEDLIHCIIKSGIDEIIFSIDSPNEDSYNFIRKGSEFKQVIANLRAVQELKTKYGVPHPAITIEFVAMRRNIEELPDMVRLAADLDVKRIIVTSIVVATKGLEQESLYYHQELANKIFDEVENIAKENEITVVLPDRFGTKSNPQGYCNDPQDTFYVRAEGTVIPCCVATNAVIGDLNNEDSKDIWMGERRKNFMDNLRKRILVGECKTCYKFTGNDINLRSTHIKV